MAPALHGWMEAMEDPRVRGRVDSKDGKLPFCKCKLHSASILAMPCAGHAGTPMN